MFDGKIARYSNLFEQKNAYNGLGFDKNIEASYK